MKKKILAVLLASVLGIAAAGCGSNSGNDSSGSTDTQQEGVSKEAKSSAETVEVPEGESVSQDTDIVAAVNVDFTTLDPLDTSDTLSGDIQRMLMDGLFGFDREMNVIPMLAESYEANEEATEYTFTLRQGITFSDGTPWNAEAAKANFDRWGDKSLGLKRTTLLCNILDSTEIVDEYTIKVTLTQSFGAFINTLAHPACVCMSPVQIAAGSEVCASDPVGTGQYTFVEWIAGDHLTVQLNPDWWGYDADICGGEALVEADAGFKSVTFRPVTESATRVAMIQSGDAQLIWPVPSESIDSLREDSSVYLGAETGDVVRYLMMNNQKEPFNDVRVRQAINYAIDKNAYIAVVKDGNATVAQSVIGQNVQYFKANEPYEYDIEKAKELLAEAGYPDGFTTSIMYANTTANQKQCEFLKQQLEQVGIEVELNGMESAILNQKIQDVDVPGSEAEVEMYVIGWSTSTGDADWGIRPLLATESEPPMSYNICYYENEEVDNLLYEALGTSDSDKRAEAYAKAQDIIWEESPLVCLAYDYNTWANSKNIVNVGNTPDGGLYIRNARMAAE
ncbi:MAG TPA: glutathione ABC transporter substrate-binding protein [Candidatus Blautia merdipullorum]|nr:glutathione ABC transporter substrate-binding protein [Candidatus Blautia merdipullorum]